MASLKQMGRDKLESLRREEGKKRERGKRAENQPVIEMASGKKKNWKAQTDLELAGGKERG